MGGWRRYKYKGLLGVEKEGTAEERWAFVAGKFRHLPVVEKGEVVALLDITKCLYDAIARMERAAEKGSAIAAAVEGVERQWGQNLTGTWPIGLVLPFTVLALQTLGLLWTAWDLQKNYKR